MTVGYSGAYRNPTTLSDTDHVYVTTPLGFRTRVSYKNSMASTRDSFIERSPSYLNAATDHRPLTVSNRLDLCLSTDLLYRISLFFASAFSFPHLTMCT